jgi:hypothetical protein
MIPEIGDYDRPLDRSSEHATVEPVYPLRS